MNQVIDKSYSRANFVLESNIQHAFSIKEFRSYTTFLPLTGVAAGGVFGIDLATAGTDEPVLFTIDFEGLSSSNFGLAEIILPDNYVDGSSISLWVRGKTTSVPEVDAGIDAQIYKSDGDGTLGSDLVTGAEVPLTNVLKSCGFGINGTSLSRGDKLQIALSLRVNDTGGNGSLLGFIYFAALYFDIRA